MGLLCDALPPASTRYDSLGSRRHPPASKRRGILRSTSSNGQCCDSRQTVGGGNGIPCGGEARLVGRRLTIGNLGILVVDIRMVIDGASRVQLVRSPIGVRMI